MAGSNGVDAARKLIARSGNNFHLKVFKALEDAG
jgi:hypothetical protein